MINASLPFAHDLPPSASALSGSHNKRVSGYVPPALRPNPSLSLRTSDTRWTLYSIAGERHTKTITIWGEYYAI